MPTKYLCPVIVVAMLTGCARARQAGPEIQIQETDKIFSALKNSALEMPEQGIYLAELFYPLKAGDISSVRMTRFRASSNIKRVFELFYTENNLPNLYSLGTEVFFLNINNGKIIGLIRLHPVAIATEQPAAFDPNVIYDL